MPLSKNILIVTTDASVSSADVQAQCAHAPVEIATRLEDVMRLFDKKRFGIIIVDLRNPSDAHLQLLEWFHTRPSFALFAALVNSNSGISDQLKKIGVRVVFHVENNSACNWKEIFEDLNNISNENFSLRHFSINSNKDNVLVGESSLIRSLAANLFSLAKLREPLWISGSSGIGKNHVTWLISKIADHNIYKIDLSMPWPRIDDWLSQNAGHNFILQIKIPEDYDPQNLILLNKFITELAQKNIPAFLITNCDLRSEDFLKEDPLNLGRKLAVHKLHLTPLEQRPEDISPLIEHFLLNDSRGQGVVHLTDDALKSLVEYEWPGQVSELWEVLSASATNPALTARSLPQKILRQTFYKRESGVGDLADMNYADAKQKSLSDFNQAYLSEVLRKSEYNITVAAEKAGMDRSNFKKILRKNQLDTE